MACSAQEMWDASCRRQGLVVPRITERGVNGPLLADSEPCARDPNRSYPLTVYRGLSSRSHGPEAKIRRSQLEITRMHQRSSASRMSCSNNAPRPRSVIVKLPRLFASVKPNALSLPAILIGTGGCPRFVSVAVRIWRNQSKSSGLRYGSMAIISTQNDIPVHWECRSNRWRREMARAPPYHLAHGRLLAL